MDEHPFSSYSLAFNTPSFERAIWIRSSPVGGQPLPSATASKWVLSPLGLCIQRQISHLRNSQLSSTSSLSASVSTSDVLEAVSWTASSPAIHWSYMQCLSIVRDIEEDHDKKSTPTIPKNQPFIFKYHLSSTWSQNPIYTKYIKICHDQQPSSSFFRHCQCACHVVACFSLQCCGWACAGVPGWPSGVGGLFLGGEVCTFRSHQCW